MGLLRAEPESPDQSSRAGRCRLVHAIVFVPCSVSGGRGTPPPSGTGVLSPQQVQSCPFLSWITAGTRFKRRNFPPYPWARGGDKMSESDKGPRRKRAADRPPYHGDAAPGKGLGGAGRVSPRDAPVQAGSHAALPASHELVQPPPAPRNPAHGEAPPGDEKGLERKSHETLTGQDARHKLTASN